MSHAIEQLKESMKKNFNNRESADKVDYDFVYVTGHVRSGKTRFGHHCSDIIGQYLKSISPHGLHIHEVVYIFVDFNNGSKWQRGDGDKTADVLLGARLAYSFKHQPGSLYPSGTVATVLDAVISLIIAQSSTPDSTDSVVPIVIHFDEHNNFIKEGDEDGSVFRGMLNQLGSYMFGTQKSELSKRGAIIPIITGTSFMDVDIRSSRVCVNEIHLDSLSNDECKAMSKDWFTHHSNPEVTRAMDTTLKDPCFNVALADCNGMPGLVAMLFSGGFRKDGDWGNELKKIIRRYASVDISKEVKQNLANIIFASRPVTRRDKLSSRYTVHDLEKHGVIRLLPTTTDNKYMLTTAFPLFQLWMSGDDSVFPADLLFSPTHLRPWTWAEFELFHCHFLCARLNALVALSESKEDSVSMSNTSKSQDCRVSVSDLFSGPCGLQSLLETMVPVKTVNTHKEKGKFIKTKGEGNIDCTAKINIDRYGKSVSVSHDDGIFICERGNALVDARFTLGNLTFVIQYEHSDRMNPFTNITPVNLAHLRDWYEDTANCFLPRQQEQLVYVFITNRHLSNNVNDDDLNHLWLQCPRLLFITHEQMQHLHPMFSGRGLLAIANEE